MFPGRGRDSLQEGVEGGINVWPRQSVVDWGGLKELWGCSGVEVIFVLFLSFISVNICAVFEYQLKTYLTLYIGDILLKQQDYLMFSD